jgi:hypothetical protein
MQLARATRRLAIVGAAAVLAVSGAAVAVAGGSSPDVYKGRIAAQSKTLYNVSVNPRSGPSCKSGDKLISWNEQGPPGPRRATGVRGPQGPQGPAGTDGGEVSPLRRTTTEG